MRDGDIHKIIPILKKEVRRWPLPVVGAVAEKTRDPFKILIACILSLRTQDRTTAAASERLFLLAETPYEISRLSQHKIAKAIFPVGFYRTKAKNIRLISQELIRRFGGEVPRSIDRLLTLQGVGRKTANLVMTVGFRKPGICVDTHVHRITNRFGYVRTKTPDQTEMALREKLPRRYWISYNDLLVPYGQQICRPLAPKCSICRVRPYCDQVGVQRSR